MSVVVRLHNLTSLTCLYKAYKVTRVSLTALSTLVIASSYNNYVFVLATIHNALSALIFCLHRVAHLMSYVDR